MEQALPHPSKIRQWLRIGRKNNPRKIDKAKRLKHASKYVYQIAFGAEDERNRLWLHEGEARGIVKHARKGYAPTYFEDEKIWRSRRGYFVLFVDKDGTKGMLFSPTHDTIEAEDIHDESFPGGKRRFFKAGDPLEKRELFHVVSWPAHVTLKLADIDRAIDLYTDEYEKQMFNHAVLFETDHIKGVFRSGAGAYLFEHAGNLVQDVRFFIKTKLNDKLVNPYGEDALERALGGIDKGFSLRALLQPTTETTRSIKNLWRRAKAVPMNMSREEWEVKAFRHHHVSSMLYLHGQNPVSKEEQKLQRNYYTMKRAMLLMLAVTRKGKYFFRTFDKAATTRSIFANLLNAIRGYLIGGIVLVAIPVVSAALSLGGILKTQVNRDVLLDVNDPLVKRYSKPAHRIEAFRTLQRHVRPEALHSVTILSAPTFDNTPPRGIKTEKSFDVWPSDLLETSLQERGRSIIRFYFNKDAKPSAAPHKDVRAFKVMRTDGIVSVKFIHEHIVWGFYLGQTFDPDIQPPPKALLDELRAGYVVQIQNFPDRPSVKSYMTLANAEKKFREVTGRPLIEDGIARPLSASPFSAPVPESYLIKAFQRTAAEELAPAAAQNIGNGSVSAQNKEEKTVQRLLKKYAGSEQQHSTMMREFTGCMSVAIKLLEDSQTEFDLRLLNVTCASGEVSAQMLCTFSNGQYATIMTKNGRDLWVVEKGEAQSFDRREVVSYIRNKIRDCPKKPRSGRSIFGRRAELS